MLCLLTPLPNHQISCPELNWFFFKKKNITSSACMSFPPPQICGWTVRGVWFRLGCLSCALGVALGAFGAHALKGTRSDYHLKVWDTAVHYQFVHGLGLIIVAAVGAGRTGRSLAGWCFSVGTALFSGSLYALVLTERAAWGAVTPIGGLLFIAGWLALALN